MKNLARVLVLMLLTCCCCAAEETPEFYQAPKQITVTFTGDCTLGCDPRERGKETGFDHYIEEYGIEYPFAQVKDIFASDDLTVLNLEGVFYDYDANRAAKTYTFRGAVDYARMLPLASVEAVSLGNNHTMDYGKAGFESTVAALEANGVEWFGTTECSNRSWIYEKDGIRLGFVSVNISYWWRSGNGLKMKQLLADLKEAGCTVIVGCMHGGVEYADFHDSTQEKLADALLKNGADIVVGNHPHVIQGMRVQDGKTTLWSLGNFSFGGNSQVRSLSALIAQVTFSFDDANRYLGHQIRLLPVNISGDAERNDYQPRLITGMEAEKAILTLQADSSPRKTVMQYREGEGALQPFVPAP